MKQNDKAEYFLYKEKLLHKLLQYLFLDLAEEKGLYLIHPFNNIDVIAGQGTIAVEFLKEMQDADNIIIPVGGGGLASSVLHLMLHAL